MKVALTNFAASRRRARALRVQPIVALSPCSQVSGWSDSSGTAPPQVRRARRQGTCLPDDVRLPLQVGIALVGTASVLSGEGSASRPVPQAEMIGGMGLIVLSQARPPLATRTGSPCRAHLGPSAGADACGGRRRCRLCAHWRGSIRSGTGSADGLMGGWSDGLMG